MAFPQHNPLKKKKKGKKTRICIFESSWIKSHLRGVSGGVVPSSTGQEHAYGMAQSSRPHTALNSCI